MPGYGATIMFNKINVLFQRFKTGLAQQDRAATWRRAFNHRFGGDTPAGHGLLDQIDIESAWC
ncbi:hypothetical protein D3C87_2172240 [compost metagenome]